MAKYILPFSKPLK